MFTLHITTGALAALVLVGCDNGIEITDNYARTPVFENNRLTVVPSDTLVSAGQSLTLTIEGEPEHPATGILRIAPLSMPPSPSSPSVRWVVDAVPDDTLSSRGDTSDAYTIRLAVAPGYPFRRDVAVRLLDAGVDCRFVVSYRADSVLDLANDRYVGIDSKEGLALAPDRGGFDGFVSEDPTRYTIVRCR